MGESQSKEDINSAQSQELQKLKQEVMQIEPTIRTNVRVTVSHTENALSAHYHQLRDQKNVIESVKAIFAGSPGLGFVLDAASRLLSSLTSSDQSNSMVHWQMCHKIVRQGNYVYGMELHYKIKKQEGAKTHLLHHSSDAKMLVAFNYMVHIMDYDPENFPNDQELGKLTL